MQQQYPITVSWTMESKKSQQLSWYARGEISRIKHKKINNVWFPSINVDSHTYGRYKPKLQVRDEDCNLFYHPPPTPVISFPSGEGTNGDSFPPVTTSNHMVAAHLQLSKSSNSPLLAKIWHSIKYLVVLSVILSFVSLFPEFSFPFLTLGIHFWDSNKNHDSVTLSFHNSESR